MTPKICLIVSAMLLFFRVSVGAQTSDAKRALEIPDEVRLCAEKRPSLALDESINPFYIAGDFDGDGNLDVMINGNDFGTEVSVGRYDALNGLMLKGDGKGNFSPQSILQSGIYIPGDGKALVKLQGGPGKYMLAASQNNGPLKIFELKRKVHTVKLGAADMYAIIRYKDGETSKQEFYYGESFLSQSGRFLSMDNTMESVKITDTNGHTRDIPLK